MRRAIAVLLAVCFWAWSLPAAQYTPGPGQLGSHAAGGGGTWTKVHETTGGPFTCNTTCPDVTVPATAVGNLMVAIAYGSTNARLSSSTSGGTWTSSANCLAYQASTGSVSCAYVVLTSSVTTMSMVTSGSLTSAYINFREYNVSSGMISALTIPAGTTSASCSNNCTTASVTLGSGSTLLVAGISTGNTGCSVASPWGDFAAPAGDGAADRLNASAGTGATFTQGSSCPTAAASAASMIAIGFNAQ